MGRTAERPIPSGRIAPSEALAFGIVLAAFSVATLGLLINWLSAALLAFTIFFYAVVYTMWLKRWTPQNIVIGGAAGAIPPVIGWTAVTGSVALEPLVLFLIIFLWTPPHFWALALFKAADYGRAGVPMMPNVAGIRSTQTQIFVYSILLAVSGLLPFALGYNGPVYGAAALVLGGLFVRHAWAVYRMDPADKAMVPAKKLFGYSILYLFALFAVLLGERVIMDLM
jgi:protoheme IX farnesyltransferase